MNTVTAYLILNVLCLFRLNSGQGCKESFYHWMFKKPVDNSRPYRNDDFSKSNEGWQMPHTERSSKERVVYSEMSSTICSASPKSADSAILPNCMNLNLTAKKMSEQSDEDNLFQLNAISSNSTHDGTKNTALNCDSLTPQLFECSLISYAKGCYEVDPKTQRLRVRKTAYLRELGDYFIDQQDRVFLCAERLPYPVTSPRCNYVTLKSSHFKILSNNLLYVNESKKFIQRPVYKPIDQNSLNVCYPLSIEFLNCPEDFLYVVERNQYDKLPGLKLFYRTHNQIVDPSYYYQYNDYNDVVVCVSGQSMKVCTLMGITCVWLEILSVAFLLFTITYEVLVPKKSNHRTCLIFHGLTMLLYYMSVLVERLVDGHTYFSSCYFFFFAKYFTMTSAFTWLTALAVDICSSFSALQTSYCQCGMPNKHTILKYNIFAWGLPFIMCILVAIVEFNKNLQQLLFLYPNTDTACQCLCWFNNQYAASFFHYVLDTCLATTNIILYVITIYNIRHESKDLRIVNYKYRRQL